VGFNPTWPNLAGLSATYQYKQLQDYKTGKRQHPIMTGLAAALSDQAMADVAAYYAGQPPATAAASARDLKQAERLVSKGDGARLIPACASCHGFRGEGNIIDIPRLAGQKAAYFKQTMFAYKNGTRTNDIYARMRLLAQALTEEEIALLAEYYATLGPPPAAE
jgi:cytochrome c553